MFLQVHNALIRLNTVYSTHIKIIISCIVVTIHRYFLLLTNSKTKIFNEQFSSIMNLLNNDVSKKESKLL